MSIGSALLSAGGYCHCADGVARRLRFDDEWQIVLQAVGL